MHTRDGFRIYSYDADKGEVLVHDGRPYQGRESSWVLVYRAGDWREHAMDARQV